MVSTLRNHGQHAAKATPVYTHPAWRPQHTRKSTCWLLHTVSAGRGCMPEVAVGGVCHRLILTPCPYDPITGVCHRFAIGLYYIGLYYIVCFQKYDTWKHTKYFIPGRLPWSRRERTTLSTPSLSCAATCSRNSSRPVCVCVRVCVCACSAAEQRRDNHTR